MKLRPFDGAVRAVFHLSGDQLVGLAPLLRAQLAHRWPATAQCDGGSDGRVRRHRRFHVMRRPEFILWPDLRGLLVSAMALVRG